MKNLMVIFSNRLLIGLCAGLHCNSHLTDLCVQLHMQFKVNHPHVDKAAGIVYSKG